MMSSAGGSAILISSRSCRGFKARSLRQSVGGPGEVALRLDDAEADPDRRVRPGGVDRRAVAELALHLDVVHHVELLHLRGPGRRRDPRLGGVQVAGLAPAPGAPAVARRPVCVRGLHG